MQSYNILQSKSKIYSNLEALHKYYWIVWNNNLSYHRICYSKPEIYFFRSGKRITITKFSFFADNPFKNKHAFFVWWNQKWRETKINGSNSRENKVLSLAMDITLDEPVQTEILWEDGRLRSLKIFTEVFVRFAKELY